MEAIGTLVGQLGFPIAIAVFFVLQNKSQYDKLMEIAIQSSTDSKATTEALKSTLATQDRANAVLANNEKLMMRLEARLDAGEK